jgi:general secretion pathway protein N
MATLQGSINPLWLVPIESLSAIQVRPIFSPSRRRAADLNPSLVQHGPSLVGQALRPALVLVGAVAGETDGIGIFLEGATKDIVRLKTGESHLGWTLSLVKGREATLQRGAEIEVLEIPNP